MVDATLCISGTIDAGAMGGPSAQALATFAGLRCAGILEPSAMDDLDPGLGRDPAPVPVQFQFAPCVDAPESVRRGQTPFTRSVEGRLAIAPLTDADAAIDVAPALEFTDACRGADFRRACEPMLRGIRTKTPLFLGPRRIGPFRSAAAAETARGILCRARLAWASDALSFERMRTLLGVDFDPTRHLLGVDATFALGSAPIRLGPERLPWFLGRAGRDRPRSSESRSRAQWSAIGHDPRCPARPTRMRLRKSSVPCFGKRIPTSC